LLRSGLVSVTFRQLTPEDIVALVQRAGLDGLEWGGDIHVPHGDLARARAVGALTREAGLAVFAYGSYYRVGYSAAAGLAWESVLETALALGAPLIRVWAGDRVESRTAEAAVWERVVEDGQRIAALAETAGITIAFEHHGGTLADTPTSALELLHRIGAPNLRSYWQPLFGMTPTEHTASLNLLLPVLAHLHVYQWQLVNGELVRFPLEDGAATWRSWLSQLAQQPRDVAAMLEFVRNDTPEQFLADAAVLRSLLADFA